MTAASLPSPDAPVSRVLAKLTRVKPNGARSWMARCPVHDDNTASLSVKEGRDSRVLLHCHAGCATTVVVLALGLTMGDLHIAAASPYSPAVTAPTRSTAMVKSYDYTDASGALLFQACRFHDASTGTKTFRQRRPDGHGGWVWSLGDLSPVLYRLPEVMSAVESGRRVFIVEGEKDADALADMGYTATTNPMGAGKWRESMSGVLTNADVVILPDNDEPGKAHADQVAASCTAVGATVKVVCLPDLPPKGDVSDWLDKGADIDALESLIGMTPRWTADAMQAQHRTRWRLDELWENDAVMRPPPPIVPRLAYAGRSTLLSAREKSGKSTLTGYLTACVSNGSEFLGERCAEGDVLVIGLEEFIGDTARRLKHFGANGTRVHLVDRFAGDGAMRADELRAHVEAIDPLLVIVDSLTAYAHGQIQDDNNATQMQKVVQPLSDLVHELKGVALLLIHHTTKSTGRSRGSTAITAGVDVVCEFDIPSEDTDPTLRRMRSVGRVPIPRVYDIRFDGDTYTLATSVETPIDERIIAVVTDRPLVSPSDVAEVIDARRTDVLTRIGHLLASGRLRNAGQHSSRPKLVVPGHPLLPADA